MKLKIKPLVGFFLLMLSSPLWAIDDTEVFVSANLGKPNLLFVMDMSGSMAWGLDATGSDNTGKPPYRIDVMKNALKRVLNKAPDNLKIGLMNYGPGAFDGADTRVLSNTWSEDERSHAVDGIAFPVSDTKAKALPILEDYVSVDNLPNPQPKTIVKDFLNDVVDSWTPYGGTPIVDSYAEAVRYFSGEKMFFGQDIPSSPRGSHPASYEGHVVTRNLITTPRNYASSPKYKTPIEGGCESNFIALLSDGEPTYYYDDQLMRLFDWRTWRWYWTSNPFRWGKGEGPFASYMMGNSNYGKLAESITSCEDRPNGFVAGKCGPEIAEYVANNDINSDIPGIQTIKTFTIGFSGSVNNATQEFLKSMSTIEDVEKTPWVDGYYEANDAQKLEKALDDIVQQVSESASTLASPGYSVNVKSGLEHEDDIYIPVFEKKDSARWSGNLKKFKIVDQSSRRVIQGKNNQDAVTELGLFTDGALDYWSESTTADGAEVAKGGVINLLDPKNRNLFSDLTCNSYPCQLNTADNELTTLNAKNGMITNSVLNVDSSYKAADREKLVNYIRGKDEKGKNRRHMGDMLHSEPIIVTYDKGGVSGVGKRQVLFAGTNEGYLHAFDAKSGEELFAFMPKMFLKNIEPQFLNAGTAADHKYGIDGNLTYWHKDEGVKGVVDGNDKVYLYFGLRRGGRAYYALDVTNTLSGNGAPQVELLWKIDSGDSGFANLGQSWSPVYLAKIGIGNSSTRKEVAIFTGGYDPVQDSTKTNSKAKIKEQVSMGNDIFIVDAVKGDLIWSLKQHLSHSSKEELKYSLPGGARLIDTNRNGAIDRMYFGDTGGNVWRLDLNEKIRKGSSDSVSKLAKLADLTGNTAGNGSNVRKFYNEPDVSILGNSGKIKYLVSIGSGYRANPLNKAINDHFFVLIDELPFSSVEDDTFETIETTDLAKVTISNGGSPTVVQDGNFGDGKTITSTDKKGWYVAFADKGEKVLASSVTVNGVVSFTTLVPEKLHSSSINSCEAPTTHGRFYSLNVLTGKSGVDLNDDGEVSSNEPAYIPISVGEIPGRPQRIFNSADIVVDNPDTAQDESSCEHLVDLRVGKKLSQSTAYNACRLESVYWNDSINDQ